MKRSEVKKKPLSDTTLTALEPEAKTYRIYDSDSLYFCVRESGNKYWHLRLKKGERWSWITLGRYPKLSAKEARLKVKQLQQQADHIEKETQITFNDAFQSWFDHKQKLGRAPSTLKQIRIYFNKIILPAIGSLSVDKITRQQCTQLQQEIEEKRLTNLAVKARGWLKQVFSFAIAQGLTENNPASELRHLATLKDDKTPYPHLKEAELREFLLAFADIPCRQLVKTAIDLLMRTAARPGMVRFAEWSEIDFDQEIWSIPAAKMKMRRNHLIPLPNQCITALKQLKKINTC